MKKLLFPATALAVLSLAACDNKPTVVSTTAPDPNAAELAKRGKVELPPMMTSEVTFRCKDQSLAYVTFFQGDKQAVVKDKQDGPATVLKAENAGDPLTAEGGWKLTGDETKGISLTLPSKPAIACHV